MLKKIFLIITFLFLTNFTSFALGRIQGFAEKGGKHVVTSATTSYKLMETYPNSTITVYLAGTTTLAPIYTNSTGTIAKANPFTADSTAYFAFYAQDGNYDLKFSGTGITTPFTLSNFTIATTVTIQSEIDIRTHGALCNGTTNDSAAFLAAINAAMVDGAPKTIRIPSNTNGCVISTTLTKDFSSSFDITFKGDGSGSIIKLATGGSVDAINFTNGNSIIFQDIVFVGTAGIQDVRYGIKLTNIQKALFEDCYFYGLASSRDLVLATTSYLTIRDSKFLGCASDGSFGYSIVNNETWSGILIENSQFFDYGELNNVLYTKGGIGFPQAWIRAGRPKTTLREVIVGTTPGILSTANSQGVYTVKNCYFDEGAIYSIYASSDVAGGSPPIERSLFEGNNHSITNAGGAGIYLRGTTWTKIKRSWFGYTYSSDAPAVIMEGAGDVTVENCILAQRVTGFFVLTPTAGGTTSKLTIIDTIYQSVFAQVPVLIETQVLGKVRRKDYAAGGYLTAALNPVYDLEVPDCISLGGLANWCKGNGSPEGVLTAPIGSHYSRLDGGAGTSWYIKESGSGNTGWVAK